MKMKKLISLFLVLVLTVSALGVLSACGGGNDTPDGETLPEGAKNTNAVVDGDEVTAPSEGENDPTYGQYFVLSKMTYTKKANPDHGPEAFDTQSETVYEWTSNSRMKSEDGNKTIYIEFDADGYYTKLEYYTGDGDLKYTYEYDHNALPGIEFFAQNNALNAIDHTYDEEHQHIITSEFDEAGRVVSTTRTRYDGSIFYTYTYQYNENGNVHVEYIEYNSDGALVDTSEYDGHKNLTHHIGYKNGDVTYDETYEYDANGELIKYTCLNGDGSFRSGEVNEYNANGDLIKCTQFKADGSAQSVQINEYDASGNLIKSERYSDGNESAPSNWAEYVYDANGNLVTTTYYADGNVSSEYEYDTFGNITKKISYDKTGAVDSIWEYEYDANGNQTKCSLNSEVWYECEYDANGNILTDISYHDERKYEYEYDGSGNLIKRTLYKISKDTSEWAENTSWGYEYDENGNLTKEVLYSSGGEISEVTEYEWIPATEAQYKAEQLVNNSDFDD